MKQFEELVKKFDEKTQDEQREILTRLHRQEGLSQREIAKLLGCSPGKANRIMSALSIPLLTKSEVQTIKLKTGRLKHPTQGKTTSEDTKRKISEKISADWVENREKRDQASQSSVEFWKNLDPTEKSRRLSKASDGIRAAAESGSKLEKYIASQLQTLGFASVKHKTGVLRNNDLEFDLYLPEISTIIEVDGPSHRQPIWGDDVLVRNVNRDEEKAGSALAGGFNFVRVIQDRNLSQKYMRDIWEALKAELTKIKEEHLKSYYVEVTL